MEKKFEHGPIQKAWIASLRAHPERQMTKKLGKKLNDGTYQACCLGEGGLIAGVCEWRGETLWAVNNNGNYKSDFCLIGNAYKALGLYGDSGMKKPNDERGTIYLSNLNDSGTTWPEIADLLESDPENWFTHSV